MPRGGKNIAHLTLEGVGSSSDRRRRGLLGTDSQRLFDEGSSCLSFLRMLAHKLLPVVKMGDEGRGRAQLPLQLEVLDVILQLLGQILCL